MIQPIHDPTKIGFSTTFDQDIWEQTLRIAQEQQLGPQDIIDNFILDKSSGQSPMAKLFSEMQPQINLLSLPLAFGISVGIGIMFGLYPARAAAKLDPIEALRHE